MLGATFENLLSAQLDGVDENIDLGDNFNFERNEPFSLVTWMKTLAAGGVMLSRRGAGPAFQGWSMNNVGGKVSFDLFSNNVGGNSIVVRTDEATFNNGVWYNIIGTYDGSSLASGVKIYVDGVNKAVTASNDNLTASIQAAVNAKIGSDADGSDPWNGKLDEPAIYNKELSSAEVSDIYNLGIVTNLLKLSSNANQKGWWRFTQNDKDNFPTIKDISGNGKDGTAVNMEVADIQGDVP